MMRKKREEIGPLSRGEIFFPILNERDNFLTWYYDNSLIFIKLGNSLAVGNNNNRR